MYYAHTIAAIQNALLEFAPDIHPKQCDIASNRLPPICHLLWMCDEIEQMDTLREDDAFKAGRWIGWILAHTELMVPYWSNNTSRESIRIDIQAGYHKPHQT